VQKAGPRPEKPSLVRVPGTHQIDEMAVRRRQDVETPILWIRAHARVVDTPAEHAEIRQASAQMLEVAAVFLYQLDVEAAVRSPWHAPLRVEVAARIRRSLGRAQGVEWTGDPTGTLDDPDAPGSLLVDPTPLPDPTEDCLKDRQPLGCGLGNPERSVEPIVRPVVGSPRQVRSTLSQVGALDLTQDARAGPGVDVFHRPSYRRQAMRLRRTATAGVRTRATRGVCKAKSPFRLENGLSTLKTP